MAAARYNGVRAERTAVTGAYLPSWRSVLRRCDSLTVQTGHNSLNVARADGSVRMIAPGMSSAAWCLAVLPRDGPALGSDW
jgi:hypothetical protein